MFISTNDPNYALFMEFVNLMCHSFFLVIALNAFEMTGSTAIQALGNIKKATILSFIRQILLLIPISLLLCIGLQKGIYGILYAGAISDIICFVIALFVVGSEYKKLSE